MDIGQAYSMFHVDAIKGAVLIEKPLPEKKSSWIVKFEMNKPLPRHLSDSLETARGEEKVFRTAEAALKDLKTIGVTEVAVRLSNVG
jgi:hypothetical protein